MSFQIIQNDREARFFFPVGNENETSNNGKRSAYFLQLDIHNFFMSIDKNILVSLIQKHVPSGALLNLTEQTIRHDCTQHFIRRGDPALAAQLPHHKSLFHSEAEKGLPIGNLTSQFFANVILNELDQFVKHQLKCKFYVRYMDDFILLHSSEIQLQKWNEQIIAFLQEKLLLRLKTQIVLKRVNEGADFLGYIVRPHYKLVRNRVVGNLRWKLQQFEACFVGSFAKGRPDRATLVHTSGLMKEGMSQKIRRLDDPRNGVRGYRFAQQNNSEILSSYHFFAESSEQFKLRQILASYLGHLKQAQSHHLIQNLWKHFPFLNLLLRVDEHRKLHPVNEPPYTPANLKAQYRWFQSKYKPHLIFFQMGNYVEFYEEQATNAVSVLGLKLSQNSRGFSKECGFPIKQLSHYKEKARQHHYSYVVVAENGHIRKGLKRRHMTEYFNHSHKKTL